MLLDAGPPGSIVIKRTTILARASGNRYTGLTRRSPPRFRPLQSCRPSLTQNELPSGATIDSAREISSDSPCSAPRLPGSKVRSRSRILPRAGR